MLRNTLSPDKRPKEIETESRPLEVLPAKESSRASASRRISLGKDEKSKLAVRERLLRQEREAKAKALQNKQRCLCLVNKRLNSINYLRRVLVEMDYSFWLGTSKLSAHELNEGFGQNESLLGHLYVLAYSIFALDDNKTLTGLVKVGAYAQLLEEWEYYRGGQGMIKYVMAHPTNSVNPSRVHTPSLNATTGGEGVGISTESLREDAVLPEGGITTTILPIFKPALYKFNNVVVYEYLQTPHVALSELGNSQVLESLSDALELMYNSFLDPEVVNCVGSYDALQKKIDSLVTKHYTAPYMSEISQYATTLMKNEIGGLSGGGTLGL